LYCKNWTSYLLSKVKPWTRAPASGGRLNFVGTFRWRGVSSRAHRLTRLHLAWLRSSSTFASTYPSFALMMGFWCGQPDRVMTPETPCHHILLGQSGHRFLRRYSAATPSSTYRSHPRSSRNSEDPTRFFSSATTILSSVVLSAYCPRESRCDHGAFLEDSRSPPGAALPRSHAKRTSACRSTGRYRWLAPGPLPLVRGLQGPVVRQANARHRRISKV
jgi:hypothetical protein